MSNISIFKHKDVHAKVDYVKKLHEHVKARIEKKNENYVKQANKRRKKIVFEPGNWIWVNMRKERFISKESPNSRQEEMILLKC